MNSLLVAIIAAFLLVLGYRFYGKLMERLWEVEPERKTPAVTQTDGVDYVPARHWTILFGHHFASIAGAGPIIGPVVAVAIWGWVPAIIWIVVGSIFIGAVHDFGTLMVSIRHKGRSISDVAHSLISYRAKLLFAAFLWLSLILVVAVFAAVAGKTLATTPEVVVPTFGLILVALLIGVVIYRWNLNQLLATIIGITLLFGLILLGYYFPIELGRNAATKWTVILLIYAFIASVLPVNILLQPRDYLSTFVLFFGMIFGILGLVITHPTIHTPAVIAWSGKSGTLWPMMFVVIACGAISGFHSMIASGTTSKQLTSEGDARKIGYGAMILEGGLAVLALLAVTAGLYWKGQGAEGLIYPELLEKKGWIGAFGAGYGELVRPIFGVLGMFIGITMLKTFVMTTLDSATRIGRYISEELLGEGFKITLFKNRYLSSGLFIILAGTLAFGNWKAIWPIFGASNQLVAALALIVLTTFLASRNKPTKYTLYPCIFMLITTLGALVYQISGFIQKKNFLLGGIGLILIILAGFMVVESVKVLKRSRNNSPRINTD